MKRYNMNAIGEPYPNTLGLWAMYHDIQAWALRQKAKVLLLSCRNDCASSKWVPYNQDALPCNCPRGDALREIEEILK